MRLHLSLVLMSQVLIWIYSNFLISIERVGVQDLVATSTIVEGEEITLSYVPAANEGSDQRNVRIEYLIEWYGFCCKCRTCCLEVSKIKFCDDASIKFFLPKMS